MASGRCERVLSGKRKILRTCLGIWSGVRCRSLDPRIQKEISGILKISMEDISIKATTAEKMGFVGREEGLMAYATVLLKKN